MMSLHYLATLGACKDLGILGNYREYLGNSGMLWNPNQYLAILGNGFQYLALPSSACFFKFITTLVDLLHIELILHLSHLKQMCSQTIHLTHESEWCIQTIRERADLLETHLWLFLAGAKIRTMTFWLGFLAQQPLLPNRIWPFLGSCNTC